MSIREAERLIGSNLLPVEGQDNWYVIGNSDVLEWETAENQALLLHKYQKKINALIFAGMHSFDGPLSIFVIFGIEPLDTLAPFRVGAPRNGMEDFMKLCHSEIRSIYNIIPFHPYGVGECEYKCTFDRKIIKPEADQIESILTEGLDGYAQDMTDSWNLAELIINENGIRLWWD